MDIVQLQNFLIWNALINYGVLLVWFFIFMLAKNGIRSLHTRWFKITTEQFDAIHYALMGSYKIVIFAFFFFPWIVLKFVL